MSCPKTQYLLTEYVAGDLPLLVRDEIESHLAVCQNCASELRKINQAQSYLSQWHEDEVPHWDRAVAGFRQEHGRHQNVDPGWITRWMPTLASLAMLVVMVFNTSISVTDSGFRIAFNDTQSEMPQSLPVLAPAQTQQDQLAESILTSIEQRQNENNVRLMQTLVEYTEQVNAENFERIYAYFEQQRQFDLENMQNSYQQLVASDFETMRSMQQLANFVRDQGVSR